MDKKISVINVKSEVNDMPEIRKNKKVEWICVNCGMRVAFTASTGRPMPGTCTRRTTKGPHRWVKNRTW